MADPFLSTFDGATLRITRTGAALGSLSQGDLIEGPLEASSGALDGASSDLEVHREIYRRDGPGAVAHAHPPGITPSEGPPGRHGRW